MKIVQTNNVADSNCRKDTIAVSIMASGESPFLYVYFGANVKRAYMYVLGYDNSKPVLVPVEQGGYKVSSHSNGSCHLRFRLTSGALNIFGNDVSSKVREDIKWEVELERRIRNKENTDDMEDNPPNGKIELTGRIDNELRVWIE